MTDRVNHLTVILDRDIRIDDVESLMNAIKQMRDVLGVKPGIVEGDVVAEMRIRSELHQRLWNALKP